LLTVTSGLSSECSVEQVTHAGTDGIGSEGFPSTGRHNLVFHLGNGTAKYFGAITDE
jgi:hypothetical protein